MVPVIFKGTKERHKQMNNDKKVAKTPIELSV